jgi:TonB-linked SusC/RagA family outer membrane protein
MRSRRFVRQALPALFALLPVAAFGQGGTIRGHVTGKASGQPLQGVYVTFSGRATQTRADGQFVLANVTGSDTLRVRLIGYSPAARLVTVGGGQTVDADMTLEAQAVALAEMVVTGYGEQRAGNITGAVTQVSAEQFNTGRIVSPEELIRSKVAGVQVVDNNEPGGGISVRIRGTTSVNASSEPLYVIDGIPVGTGAGGGLSAGRNALNFLNPDDIETITVLRDASAAAIYGANAANGVVLVQTKTGRGRPQFTYTGSLSASSITRRPEMLTAAEFRAAVQQYAPQSVGQLGTANTDWFGQIERTGFGQEHNLAVSGSDPNTNWRVSGGFLKQEGIIRGSSTQRISLDLNFNQRLFDDRLDVRLTQKGSRNLDGFTPGGVLSNATQMGPTQPVTDPKTTTGYYDWPGNTLQSADNPIALLAMATDRGTTYRSLGGVQTSYRVPFLDALTAHANLNYDVARTDRQTFFPSVLHGQLKSGQKGSDYRANQSQTNTGLETYLSYAAQPVAIPGAIDVTAGYSYSQSHAEYPWYLATGLSTDLLRGNGVTSAQTTQNVQDIQESRLISFFGRANYNLRDRYLVGASIRRDGSSRFGAGNQWGVFPSVSLGWRLSEEDFFRDKRSISDLKLRASWAKTGNQAFANYQQYATYVLGDAQTRVQFGSDYVATIRPGAYDPNIRWEATKATDVGLDFGFWNQRLTGAIDWYDKKTDNLIFTVPVAAGTNLSNYLTTNIGSMKNRGVELSVSTPVLQGANRGLNWTVDFTAAHNDNELVAINPIFGDNAQLQRILTGLVSGGVGTYIQVLQPGQPVNAFFVYQHRNGANGKPVFKEGAGADTAMYVDQNHDGTINQDDRVPLRSPSPKWILGHTSNLGYGRYTLSLTMRAYLGNYVYNNVASNLGTYSEVTRASPYNLHASVLETGFKTPQYLSDYYVEDASFLRMDNITLGRAFDYRGQPLRAYLTIQNAFTMTGYSGVDPTAGLNGLDNNIYPRSRTYSAGLTVRF